MRTKDEIELQIKGLLESRKKLPKFSRNGTPYWDIIDTQIEVLQGRAAWYFDDAESEIHHAANKADAWLNDCHDEENLF
jgi:hypothetical protein